MGRPLTPSRWLRACGDDRGIIAQTKAKLQQFWRYYEYLIIDEMSMIGKTFLAKFSRNSSIGKMMEGTAVSPQSFGVLRRLSMHRADRRVSGLSQLGRAIYEEFQTIVIVREQTRVMDNIWLDFLNHLQMGCVQEEHIAMFRQLISRSDACLVTPRHAVRQHWNEAVLCKHARLTGEVVLLYTVHDTINGAPLSIEARYAFALRTGGGELQSHCRKGDLPNTVELSVGMRVIVNQNVETDLDITNGMQGLIVDIVLHLEEPPPSPTHDIVRLKLMPAYILVKLCRTRTSQLPTWLP
ncbi:hypothetical protein F5141DRAFT_1045147 [Pisolithus sp. B1]|nr:hypothetical protein F5141DRAFT_1045147 [Pisolithus sp. B1]